MTEPSVISPPKKQTHTTQGEDEEEEEEESRNKIELSPNADPEVAAFVREHFNDQLSDDEDNSWQDELTEHADDYGEEDEAGEYGDEHGGTSPSPINNNNNESVEINQNGDEKGD